LPEDANFYGVSCGLATNKDGDKFVIVTGGIFEGFSSRTSYRLDLEV